MENPLYGCYKFFGVHRVYGIQNNRIDLTINEFSMIFKKLHSSQRYSQKC